MESDISGGETRAMENPRWYVVQTRPRQECRAEANLVAWGVETLFPRIRRRSRQAGTNGSPDVDALFPSYLFARFDAAMVAKVRYTRGVAKIVGTELGPTSVDESIIGEIRDRIGDDGYVQLVSSLNAGDRVRITSGPLCDFVGVFVAAARGPDRLRLLLSAVNAQIRVTVDRCDVEKLAVC